MGALRVVEGPAVVPGLEHGAGETGLGGGKGLAEAAGEDLGGAPKGGRGHRAATIKQHLEVAQVVVAETGVLKQHAQGRRHQVGEGDALALEGGEGPSTLNCSMWQGLPTAT